MHTRIDPLVGAPRYLATLLLVCVAMPFLSSCGTLEVGIERTATPDQVTADEITPFTVDEVTPPTTPVVTPPVTLTPSLPTPTPTLDTLGWNAYSSPVHAVSLNYPAHWQPVSGYGGPETGDTRFAGEDGFFHIVAMDAATIDDAAAAEAEHVLRPYGSRPIIENLQIQGQEARLILPSTDANMGGQAALIVRYPQPVELENICRFFVLYADQDHIRAIAQTLQFTGDDPAQTRVLTPAQPIAWENLPPGLVYSTSDGQWLIGTDEQPVQIHNNSQAVLSPDGTRILSYDPLQQDVWLLNRFDGAVWNLTRTPDRLESIFRWWPQRQDVVLFSSIEESAERGPGVMGFLTVVNVDGGGYQILDGEHDTGPGQFAPSPDGQTVAYGGGSAGWLYRWSTGPEVFDPTGYGLTGSKGVQIGSPAWSPDGARLAWVVGGGLAKGGSYRLGVGVFDLRSRTAWVVHPYEPAGRGGWPAAPVWSPDGTWLAFVAGSQDMDEAGVWVLRADRQQEEEYRLGHGGNPRWSPDGRWLAFEGFLDSGLPAYLVAEVGTWELFPLNIPPDRYGRLVDWITPLEVP
jgi:Tol biopolymer transport system component